MVYTSTNPLVVVKQGTLYRLDTLAYNISTKGGIASKMAPLRGEPIVTGGRDGSIYSKGRLREENSIVLNMWAKNTNVDDGGTPSYSVWKDNMDQLLWIFDTSGNQVELREYLNVPVSAGVALGAYTYRRAFCEVTAAIDPDYLGKHFGKFVVELRNNDAFWSDSADVTFTSPIGATSVATHVATQFAGSTAPMKELLVQVTGPITNPVVTDMATGHYVKYLGALTSTQQWLVDTTNWKSVMGTGLNFNPAAGTNQTLVTEANGTWYSRLFGLSPGKTTGPSVRLQGTGAAATTKLEIRGRRKFH